MVGLKYSGKKEPFIYVNENLLCGKMSWKRRKDIIQVPLEDAELLVENSPNDFEIVRSKEEEDLFFMPSVNKDEPEEDLDSEEDNLKCEFCDFVAKTPQGKKIHKSSKHPKPIIDIGSPNEDATET